MAPGSRRSSRASAGAAEPYPHYAGLRTRWLNTAHTRDRVPQLAEAAAAGAGVAAAKVLHTVRAAAQ